MDNVYKLKALALRGPATYWQSQHSGSDLLWWALCTLLKPRKNNVVLPKTGNNLKDGSTGQLVSKSSSFFFFSLYTNTYKILVYFQHFFPKKKKIIFNMGQSLKVTQHIFFLALFMQNIRKIVNQHQTSYFGSLQYNTMSFTVWLSLLFPTDVNTSLAMPH